MSKAGRVVLVLVMLAALFAVAAGLFTVSWRLGQWAFAYRADATMLQTWVGVMAGAAGLIGAAFGVFVMGIATIAPFNEDFWKSALSADKEAPQ